MQSVDFFRSRIDAMINLRDPLAVLTTRLHLNQIEAAIAATFAHQNRPGQILRPQDMFGTSEVMVGAGRNNAGCPKLPIRLMVSLLYLLAEKTGIFSTEMMALLLEVKGWLARMDQSQKRRESLGPAPSFPDE